LNVTLATKDSEIEELNKMKTKYEDLRVESITLKQTSQEYKKSLA